MTKAEERNSTRSGADGIVLHTARLYDLLTWVLMRGREGAFRERIINLARIQPGETVLDVGCGTGTLAIAAKRRVGPMGKVYGIDASADMIARAKAKARKARLDIFFENEYIQALSFPDGQFDVVLSTLMLHHLSRKLREDGISEIRRVLKPGGRVVVIDFGGTEPQRGLLAHFHRRHGHVKPSEVVALLGAAVLTIVESGAMGIKDLHFTSATAPCCRP